MAAALNHTIVHARDAAASAAFLSEILGLPAPRRFGPFIVVDTANGVSLDFLSTDEPMLVEHYAFLVSEAEFDEIFGRPQDRLLRRSRGRRQRRDQPQRRGPRRVLSRPFRSLPRDHHSPVRFGWSLSRASRRRRGRGVVSLMCRRKPRH